MIRFVLHRILGLGKIPAADRQALEPEGIEVAEEGIWVSITYKNYRAPGKVFLNRKRWVVGSLVVTKHRFSAYIFSRRIFNLPLSDANFAKWKVFVEDGQRLCLAGDASNLGPNHSGNLEFRFTIPDAEKLVRLLP